MEVNQRVIRRSHVQLTILEDPNNPVSDDKINSIFELSTKAKEITGQDDNILYISDNDLFPEEPGDYMSKNFNSNDNHPFYYKYTDTIVLPEEIIPEFSINKDPDSTEYEATFDLIYMHEAGHAYDLDITRRQKRDLCNLDSIIRQYGDEPRPLIRRMQEKRALKDLGYSFEKIHYKSDSTEFREAYQQDINALMELSSTNPEEAERIKKELTWFLPNFDLETNEEDPEIQYRMGWARSETFAQAFAINAGEEDAQRPDFSAYFPHSIAYVKRSLEE